MKIFKNIIFSLITLAIFLLLCEGGVRIFFPPHTTPAGDRIELLPLDDPLKGVKGFGRLFQGCIFSANTVEKNSPGLIVNRAGCQGVMIRSHEKNYVFDLELDTEKIAALPALEERTFFRINQAHLRGEEVVDDGRPRLLMLGDSITFGYYVNEEDIYVSQLQKEFPGYQLLNAGVNSYSAKDESRFLRQYGPVFQPRLIGVGFYLNDIFTLGQPLFPREYNFFFPYRKLPVIWRLGQNSRLVNLVYERLLTLPLFYSASVDPERAENVSVNTAWQNYRALLKEMHDYAQANNARLFLVVFPNAFQFDKAFTTLNYQQRLAEITRRLNVPTLDLFDTFQKNGGRQLYNEPDTVHPNATGHRLAAREIARFLRENQLLE